MTFGDHIIGLHELASTLKDDQIAFKVRMLANALAKLGNEYHEKFEILAGAPENKKLEKRV